jgi:Icc-related predicted phosphoesterase
MQVVAIESSPFHTFEHRTAAGGGRTAIYAIELYRGKVRGLPDALDALLIASDLQGVAPVAAEGGALRLVGEALAEQVATLADGGAVPALAKIGVVLAGDLYSAPAADQRGASGDVRSVWRAFAARYRWVVGVAGNHDTFGGTTQEAASFIAEPRIHLLDGATATLDGLRVGGVGGIIGDPNKPGRRDQRDFLRAMRRVLAERPAMLVMHHGPDTQRGQLRGHPEIRRALDRSGELLVVCGHVYWPAPVSELRGGAQVLNVDGRVVLLERV